MRKLHPRTIGFCKPFDLSKTAVFAIAFIVSLSTATWSKDLDIGGPRSVDVATMNLYVGAEIRTLATVNPAELPIEVARIHAQVVASNFRARAKAIAQQIVARGPDVVGLQEVSLIRRQSPGDLVIGGTTLPTNVEFDYLAILLDELEQAGGHYGVVSQVQDADVELPMLAGPSTIDDLRFTDHDVILMRTDLPPGQLRASNPLGANFTARLSVSGIDIPRGWCSIDVQMRGRSFRFVDTHIEDFVPFPQVQAAQTDELLSITANSPLPVVLVGDFNADAYGNYSPAIYPKLIGQGSFRDAWSVARPDELGLTWGHDELLSNPTVPFLYRLDLILYRGKSFDAVDADVSDPLIGPPPPLWPSDHGFVFATIAIK
jgi:endonuclease/exonuclease/phosphatase family metal-dependent hydrolase